MSNAIGYDVSGGVATITLDRPDALNSLTVAMKVGCSMPCSGPAASRTCAPCC